jgi:hypothetical protein
MQDAVEHLCGAAHDVADPEPWLEATTLIEAMHARVFSTALKEDVVTVPGPSCCERSVDNGTSMTLTSKFGMSDHIFEKGMPPSASQEIWRGNKHTGCNDLCLNGGHEDLDAVVGQHFQPDLLGSLSAPHWSLPLLVDRARAGKQRRQLEQAWHWTSEYRIVNRELV